VNRVLSGACQNAPFEQASVTLIAISVTED